MIIFFDIETVADPEKIDFLESKYPDEEFNGLNTDFGKIICLSYGYEIDDGIGIEFKNMSLIDDEKEILQKFFDVIEEHKDKLRLGGFNIVNFDIPFVFKRALVHGLKIPSILSTYDPKNGGSKKPWDLKVIDIMKIRASTGNRYTSLDKLTNIFNIESPKQDLDGSMVEQMYNDGNITDIAMYCARDVRATYEIRKKIRKLI